MSEEIVDKIAEYLSSHYFGKYRGTVEENADRTSRGRLQVLVPAVLGQEAVWAMPCVPYAGDGVGLVTLPEAGTGVWVEFEGGNLSFPIWSGFYWAENAMPEDPVAAVKIFKTGALTIRIDDDKDELTIENGAGSKITLAGKIIHEAGNGTVTVDSNGVIAEAGGTKAEVSQTAFKVNDGALEVV